MLSPVYYFHPSLKRCHDYLFFFNHNKISYVLPSLHVGCSWLQVKVESAPGVIGTPHSVRDLDNSHRRTSFTLGLIHMDKTWPRIAHLKAWYMHIGSLHGTQCFLRCFKVTKAPRPRQAISVRNFRRSPRKGSRQTFAGFPHTSKNSENVRSTIVKPIGCSMQKNS